MPRERNRAELSMPVISEPTAAVEMPVLDAGSAAERDSEKKKSKRRKMKEKVVRDSFTMPEDDYARINALKSKCLEQGLVVKKSEILRAGLRVLSDLEPEQLSAIVEGVERIKTGRPKK